MKKTITILTGITTILFAAILLANNYLKTDKPIIQTKKISTPGTVLKVIDGDTLVFKTKSGDSFLVRLTCIDAPEKDQEWGLNASKALKSLTLNKKCEFIESGKGKYSKKRKLGFIKCGKATVNLSMVQNGHAWIYYQCEIKAYKRAHKRARATNIGLFSKPNPITPYKYRKMNKK